MSVDSHSSVLLVGLSKEGRRRKEEEEGLFSKSLEEMGELKAWGGIAKPLLSCCLTVA